MSSGRNSTTGSKSDSGGKRNENIRSAAQKWIDKADYMYPTEPAESPFPKRKLIPFILAIILILAIGFALILYRINTTKNDKPPPTKLNNSNNHNNRSESDSEEYLERITIPAYLQDTSCTPTAPEELTYEDPDDQLSGTSDLRAAKKQAIQEYNQWVRKQRTKCSRHSLATPPFLLVVKDKVCRDQLTSVYHGYFSVTSLSPACIVTLNASPISPIAVPLMRDLQYALSVDFLGTLEIDLFQKLKSKIFTNNPLFPASDFQNPKHPIQVISQRRNEFPSKSKLLSDCLKLLKTK